MVFAHDTEVALRAAVDLVNTHPDTAEDGADRLTTSEEAESFLVAHRYSGAVRGGAAELPGLRGIRRPLLGLWGVGRDDAVPHVNALLREGGALPQLVIHDDYDWHIHATDDDAPLATRILVETAMAFVDVIRADEYSRVRECGADDCRAVYVDFSRNGSKRYCDTGNCGNRMNVNAYRRRQAGRRSG